MQNSHLEQIWDPGLSDPAHEFLLPVPDDDLADRLQTEESFRYLLLWRGRHGEAAPRQPSALELRMRERVRVRVRRWRSGLAHAQVLRPLLVLVVVLLFSLFHGDHGGLGLRGQGDRGQTDGQGQFGQGVDQQGLVGLVGQGETAAAMRWVRVWE